MKRTNHKFIYFLLAALILASMLTFGCAEKTPTPTPTPGAVVDEWDIPFLIFLSGPYAGFGEQIKWATEQAVQDVNAAGGIAGKPLNVTYHDTALDAAKAVAEMSKVVEDSLVIMGPVAAPTAKAAMPMAVKEGLFVMSNCCGTPIAIEFDPWMVSFLGRSEVLPRAAMEGWAKQKPDMKSVVQFVWPLDPTWMDIAASQAAILEGVGIEILDDVEVSAAVDMGAVVVKALAQNPDGFLITVGPVEAAKIVTELDKRGVKDHSKIMIFMTADDPALYEVGGEYLENCYIWNFLNVDSENPRWQSLFERFKAAHKGIPAPTIGVPLYYDAIYMLKDAIEQTGVTGDPAKLAGERIKIRDYCRNVKDFQGVMYTYSVVDGISDPPTYLFQIHSDAKVIIEVYKGG